MESKNRHGIEVFIRDCLETQPAPLLPVWLILPRESPIAELDELLGQPQLAGVVVPDSAALASDDDRRIGVIREDVSGIPPRGFGP